MKSLKRFLAALPPYVLWLMASVIVWGWIFSMMADPPPQRRVLLCVDRPQLEDRALAAELEKAMPAGIRAVRVHPFDYYLFGAQELLQADLYLVGESRAQDYLDSFLPLEALGFLPQDRALWSAEGTAYGICVYDGAAGGGLESYILFAGPGERPEPYYLFFGAQGAHTADGVAVAAAQALLALPGED